MTKRTLFDDVLEITGFMYLSDLRHGGGRRTVADAVATVDAARYSLAEWLRLAEYVAGRSPALGDAEAVREALLAYLTEPDA